MKNIKDIPLGIQQLAALIGALIGLILGFIIAEAADEYELVDEEVLDGAETNAQTKS